MAIAVLAGGLHELLDLGMGQILPGLRFGIGLALGRPAGCNCPIKVVGATSVIGAGNAHFEALSVEATDVITVPEVP